MCNLVPFGFFQMLSLKILNSKQAKEIASIISGHWGAWLSRDYAFLLNSKNKISIVSRDIGAVNLDMLRVNSVGLYFGELFDGELRLSIEGSQIIGPLAAKNIVEITGDEMGSWLRGDDLQKICEDCSGFVILKSKGDFLGCGRYSRGIIKNFVPKTRRIRNSS